MLLLRVTRSNLSASDFRTPQNGVRLVAPSPQRQRLGRAERKLYVSCYVIALLTVIITEFLLHVTFTIPVLYGGYNNVNVYESWPYASVTLTVLSLLVSYHVFSYYFLSALSDPGVLMPSYDLELYNFIQNNGMITPYNQFFPAVDLCNLFDMKVQMKYCYSCRILRPLRSSHCNDCGYCIDTLDHHCVWLGTCIGKRNYPYFFKFILSTMVATLLFLAMNALIISRLFIIGIGDAGKTFFAIFTGMIGITNVFLFILMAVFFQYHFKLVTSQLSSREFRKRISYKPVGIGKGCNFLLLLKIIFKTNQPSWLPYIKKTRILDFKEVINITLGINTNKTNPESEKKIESQENNKENQENVDQESKKPRVVSLYLAEDSLKREKN